MADKPRSKEDQAVLDEVLVEGILHRLDHLERLVYRHPEDVPSTLKVAREVRLSEVLPQLIEASILTGKPLGQRTRDRVHNRLVLKVLKALHGEKVQLLLNGNLYLEMQRNLFWFGIRTGGLVFP